MFQFENDNIMFMPFSSKAPHHFICYVSWINFGFKISGQSLTKNTSSCNTDYVINYANPVTANKFQHRIPRFIHSEDWSGVSN